MTTMVETETGTIEVLDASGHTTISWDRNNPESVASARDAFENCMKGQKYTAIIEKPTSRLGQRMDTFDPTVEAVKLVPQYQGG